MVDKYKPTYEELASPKMEAILFENGLQITLKTLIDALQKMIDQRGKDELNLMVIEGLRGLYNGYMRRYELEDWE